MENQTRAVEVTLDEKSKNPNSLMEILGITAERYMDISHAYEKILLKNPDPKLTMMHYINLLIKDEKVSLTQGELVFFIFQLVPSLLQQQAELAMAEMFGQQPQSRASNAKDTGKKPYGPIGEA